MPDSITDCPAIYFLGAPSAGGKAKGRATPGYAVASVFLAIKEASPKRTAPPCPLRRYISALEPTSEIILSRTGAQHKMNDTENPIPGIQECKDTLDQVQGNATMYAGC